MRYSGGSVKRGVYYRSCYWGSKVLLHSFSCT